MPFVWHRFFLDGPRTAGAVRRRRFEGYFGFQRASGAELPGREQAEALELDGLPSPFIY